MARKEAFVVSHKGPQLLVPAKPTPHEMKELSDIDDQIGLRLHFSMIMFYRANPLMKARDPVEAIRDALAEALVWYYPLAGRLIHGPDDEDKLMVDCSGEGILFVEADSNFSLEDLGDAIKPPCLYSKELLYHQVPGSNGILSCPLMLVQVTRLICGGFVVAISVNHVLTDGLGLAQFVKAVGELAQGASSPSTKPVWKRELLTAKHLPPLLQTTYDHREYGIVSHRSIIDDDNLVSRCFFFGPKEMKAIRQKLPLHYHTQPRSKFELITASVWICRTRALEFDVDETVGVICAINVRNKGPPELRDGYYGNLAVTSAAVTKAGRLLCDSPLEYAVELIEKAKSRVSGDYVKSVVNFMNNSNGRPSLLMSRSSIVVTDVTRLGFHEMDFGWGKPVYGGPMGRIASATSIPLVGYRNSDGQDGVLVPVFLPPTAMKRFEEELKKFTALEPREVSKIPSKSILKSAI